MLQPTDLRQEILHCRLVPRPDDLDYPDSSVEVSIDEGRYISFISEGRDAALAIDYENAVLNVEDHR